MNPEVEQALKEVEFQLSNVQGWISVSDYETAEIKTLYLIKAAIEMKIALNAAYRNTKKTDAP